MLCSRNGCQHIDTENWKPATINKFFFIQSTTSGSSYPRITKYKSVKVLSITNKINTDKRDKNVIFFFETMVVKVSKVKGSFRQQKCFKIEVQYIKGINA